MKSTGERGWWGLAYLDELLRRLFEAKLLEGKIASRLLAYPGALSTAAARSDMAYSLRWIGAKTYHDLVTLRKIRNEFAHAHEPVKFTDAAIAALCAKLRLGKAVIPNSSLSLSNGSKHVDSGPACPAAGILSANG